MIGQCVQWSSYALEKLYCVGGVYSETGLNINASFGIETHIIECPKVCILCCSD